MQEQLLGFCNTMLRELKVTPEQIEAVGGADGFAMIVAQSLIDNGLRIAYVEPEGGDEEGDGDGA